MNEGLIFELQALYEHSWPKLTEDYFEKRPWPEESEVAALVDSDPVSINILLPFVPWIDTSLIFSFTWSPLSLISPLILSFTSSLLSNSCFL